MQTGIWVFGIIIGLILFLLWGFRAAVRRGGRKVEYLNPEALIIYPPTESSVTRLDNDDLKIQWSGDAERRVPLEGAYNFRDLGGYRTRDGAYACWGKLFRADELSALTDADLNYFTAMDIQTVIDLRSPAEMKGRENRLPPGVVYRHMPVYKREPLRRFLPVILFQRHKLLQTMGESYLVMAEENAEAFGSVLRLFADPKNLPAVYHCSAGKDRTGIITAYLYALLGIPNETIIADYSLSNLGFDHYYTEFIASGRIARSGLPPDEFRALFMVDPAWMQNLLTYLSTKYGSMQNYLIEKAGLDHLTLDRIRANMLA